MTDPNSTIAATIKQELGLVLALATTRTDVPAAAVDGIIADTSDLVVTELQRASIALTELPEEIGGADRMHSGIPEFLGPYTTYAVCHDEPGMVLNRNTNEVMVPEAARAEAAALLAAANAADKDSK